MRLTDRHGSRNRGSESAPSTHVLLSRSSPSSQPARAGGRGPAPAPPRSQVLGGHGRQVSQVLTSDCSGWSCTCSRRSPRRCSSCPEPCTSLTPCRPPTSSSPRCRPSPRSWCVLPGALLSCAPRDPLVLRAGPQDTIHSDGTPCPPTHPLLSVCPSSEQRGLVRRGGPGPRATLQSGPPLQAWGLTGRTGCGALGVAAVAHPVRPL